MSGVEARIDAEVSSPDQARASKIRAWLREARARFERDNTSMVAAFLGQVSGAYGRELDAFTSHCNRDSVLRPQLEVVLGELREYLDWLAWTGDNAGHLVVFPGDADRAQGLARSMLVYVGCRLIDDGLDGHLTYKEREATLVDRLQRHGQTHAAACALSVFWGTYLIQFAVPRCGSSVGALFQEIALGALAEATPSWRVDRTTYERMVARKSAAYGLVLYRPMLAGVDPQERAAALSALAALEGAAQLLNDYRDEGDDRRRGQPNAVVAGIIPSVEVPEELARRVQEIMRETAGLARPLQDTIASMVANALLPLVGEVDPVVTVHTASANWTLPRADRLLELLDAGLTPTVAGRDTGDDDRSSPLSPLIGQLHVQNRYQWQREAEARAAGLPASALGDLKRLIDESNRVRVGLIEQIDLLCAAAFASGRRSSPMHLNSESVGQLVDRVSILTLKIVSNVAANRRTDLSSDRRVAAEAGAEVVAIQRDYVLTCYERLIEAIHAGTAALPPARQIKLYRDDDLDRRSA